MDEAIVIPLAGMSMIVVLSLGIPFVRALARRWENESRQPKVPSEVVSRLERIERISEGQRFTTKLLSERAGEPAPATRGRDAER